MTTQIKSMLKKTIAMGLVAGALSWRVLRRRRLSNGALECSLELRYMDMPPATTPMTTMPGNGMSGSVARPSSVVRHGCGSRLGWSVNVVRHGSAITGTMIATIVAKTQRG